MSSEAFRLSRIYAAGWNTAQKMSEEDLSALDATKMATLAPYETEAERTRWNDGFAAARTKRGFENPAS